MTVIIPGQIHWQVAEALEANFHLVHYAGNAAGDITRTYVELEYYHDVPDSYYDRYYG